MTYYPILFSRRDLVKAGAYTAGVIVAGRILVSDEDDEFWAEGVNPGGLAAKGDSAEAALSAFCESYHEVLLDIAEDEPSFERFKKAVEQFFADTNMVASADWDAAVLEVRAGKVTLPHMGKRPSESPTGITVLLFEGQAEKEEEVGDAAMAA
ncbi:MAG TPA: hypothetical protein VJA16_14040 [Thermoanaerobaculia bacterium]